MENFNKDISKNISIVPKTMTKNIKDIMDCDYTHMICSKTGEILPLSAFRKHRNTYYVPFSQKIESQMSRVKRLIKENEKTTDSVLIVFSETEAIKGMLINKKNFITCKSGKYDSLYFHNRYTTDKMNRAYKQFVLEKYSKNISIKKIINSRNK